MATSDDGSCPPPTGLCGSGEHARCFAFDSDPANCGACGHTCTPGIACSGGLCQQTQCTGPVTFHETGRFSRHVAGTIDFPGSQFAGADMNRDGRLDLLEFNRDGTGIVIWLGQSDGTFIASTSYPTVGTADTPALPGYAAVGDFNEDGLADLVVTRSSGASVEVRPGLPGGGLGGRTGVPLSRLGVADLDGDGHLDVVAGFNPNGSVDHFTVYRGRGNGAFANAGSYTIPDDGVWHAELHDWDADGTLDLLALGMTFHLMLGKGDGTFSQQQGCGLGVGVTVSTVFADLNQDGKLDVGWPVNERLATVLGSGNCNFSPRTNYPLSFQTEALVAGDVSGDGILDLVALGIDVRGLSASRSVRAALLLGKSDGTFATATDLNITIEGSIFISDVNDDGRADIVVTSADAGIVVYSNTCTR
jgi:hypothetical protein